MFAEAILTHYQVLRMSWMRASLKIIIAACDKSLVSLTCSPTLRVTIIDQQFWRVATLVRQRELAKQRIMHARAASGESYGHWAGCRAVCRATCLSAWQRFDEPFQPLHECVAVGQRAPSDGRCAVGVGAAAIPRFRAARSARRRAVPDQYIPAASLSLHPAERLAQAGSRGTGARHNVTQITVTFSSKIAVRYRHVELIGTWSEARSDAEQRADACRAYEGEVRNATGRSRRDILRAWAWIRDLYRAATRVAFDAVQRAVKGWTRLGLPRP
jgi:hypothetical protein